MADEIEYKFKVPPSKVEDLIAGAEKAEVIIQGYLSVGEGQGVLRVRMTRPLKSQGASSFVTLKFQQGGDARVRKEYEYPIPVLDSMELLSLFFGKGVIHKTRYTLPPVRKGDKEFRLEIDVFHGCNHGLCLAEVEVSSVEDDISGVIDMLPDGSIDVTSKRKFTNSYLTKNPYQNWGTLRGFLYSLLSARWLR